MEDILEVISVVNYKGGVGKSTLVSNMAGVLALRGKKILLVDLDPQASLTFSYMPVEEWGIEYRNKKTIKVWYEEALKNKRVKAINEFIVKDLKCNELLKEKGGEIHLVPSDIDLYRTQIQLAQKASGRLLRSEEDETLNVVGKLRGALKKIKGYDYILLDCQPSFDMITQSAIYASDYYIIPTKLDYLSTVGVQTLTRHVSNLKVWTNNVSKSKKVKVELIGVVPSMVKHWRNDIKVLHKQYKAELERSKIKVFKSSIRANDEEIDNNNGMPMVLANMNKCSISDVQKDFNDVVDELLSLI